MTVGRGEGRLPDFLGIGVVRGGTTWLWRNLSRHRGVWLPPVKEIDFFNRLHPIRGTGTAPRETGRRILADRLADLELSRLGRYLQRLRPGQLRWQARFYLGRPTERWYAGLFRDAGDRLTGDVTPHYSALADEGVRHAARLLPEARVVLILRDPVERDWSHARHFLTDHRRRPLASVTPDEFLAFFADPGTRARGDYPPMLRAWGEAFPPDRLLIAFFDDVRERPRDLMRRVCRFLGLPATDADLPADLADVVNAAPPARIPPAIHRHLAELHLPDLEWLAERLEGPPSRWLAAAREVLAAAPQGEPGADAGRLP